VLSDPKTKQAYDAYGEAGVSQAEAGGGPGGGGGGGGFNGQVDLSDIFESFFGGGGGGGGGFGGFGGGFHPQEGGKRGRAGRVASVGDDLQIDMEISFKTACFGGKEKMNIRHLEVCETCDGTRMKPGTKKKTCTMCDGHGVVLTNQQTALGTFRTESQCSKCKGLGEIIEKVCPGCYGKGNVQKVKELSVDVPCGIDNGNRILIKGEGNAGTEGGASGDLHVVIKVKPDKVFRRVGNDVHSNVDVSCVCVCGVLAFLISCFLLLPCFFFFLLYHISTYTVTHTNLYIYIQLQKKRCPIWMQSLDQKRL
jgi:molecular chaperone DnaJ